MHLPGVGVALFLAASVVASATASPRLFAVENWEKHQGGGPLPTVDWNSWRLAEVDVATGALKGVTSWKGGTLPNHGDSNGLLVGAGYSEKTQARDQLLVRESNSAPLKCYDASGNTCGEFATPNAGYMEENKGFFTYLSADDIEPSNTVFSLYDALSLSNPTHFASINTKNTTGALWMTQNWGVNNVQQVIYVAASIYSVGSKLYRVQRISGEVRELDFPPFKNSSMGMEALFVDPGASGEKLLVLLTAESYTHYSKLYELDVATGEASVVLEFPGMYLGPAASKCRALDKETRTLYLGCETVVTVSLADRKIIGTTTMQKTKPTKLTGGEYSIGGIVALSGSSEQVVQV